jgi:hypothetical protein
MKIRSLLLGSIAAAGLSTAGYAADLGVVTSLDVCDELGLSGLTISSDDNCLVITGNVQFEYDWGDYDTITLGTFANNTGNTYGVIGTNGGITSNNGDVDSWLKFTATADSDFGPASATIKLVANNTQGLGNWNQGNQAVGVGEAWVGIGDTTMIMAGYKSSIFNAGDDAPLNYLGLFNSSSVNTGVGFASNGAKTGGDVIQVVSNLGNGFSLGGGLENLGGRWSDEDNGGHGFGSNPGVYGGVLTGVGVLSYAGDGVTAHVSLAADNGSLASGVVTTETRTIANPAFDPNLATGPTNSPTITVPGTTETFNGVNAWKLHAGFTGGWDPIKVVGAFSADNTEYWNALGSVAATFDMFTLSASGEAASDGWGAGGSLSASVSDGVTLNLGGRYWKNTQPVVGNDGDWDMYQVEAGVEAAVTETITLVATVGATQSTYRGNNLTGDAHIDAAPADAVFYGTAGLNWNPGGGFKSGVSGRVASDGGYKAVFTASKSIK